MKEINGKNKNYIKILAETYENDLKNQQFEVPLIFRNPKEIGTTKYYNLYISKTYLGYNENDKNVNE